MYRANDIKTGLLHLLGWRQNYENPMISDSLTQSDSGQFFQDFHPLVTLSNMRSIAPDFNSITYATWSGLTQYRAGDRVTLTGLNYRAKIDNINLTPETNPTQWERFDQFSEWLETKTSASILKSVRTFWDNKLAAKTAANILENKTLFDNTGRITDLLQPGSGFVGFEIVPIRADGVTTKIEKIGLQMTGTGPITLYLFHSSRPDPVKTINITRTRNGGMEWFNQTDLYLPYQSDDTDTGGSWYLVYNLAAMSTNRAVIVNKDWSAKPCGSCNRDEVASYAIWSRYLEIHPFKVDISTPAMWDVAHNLYTYTSNYGINLQLSIECDVTDIILSNKSMFQNVIGLQVASDMIREMAYNPNFNINRTQQNFSRAEILYEIDGDTQGRKGGIGYNFDMAMKAIELNTSVLSRVCFPCNNKGIKYRTV